MHVLEESAGGGERALVHAVLWTAFLDARNGKSDAIAFLTDRTGSWAMARRAWLCLTDFDPDLFRGRCAKLLGIVDPPPAPPPPPSKRAPLPVLIARLAPPPPRYRTNLAPLKRLQRCRAGSRIARAIDILANGATFDELMTALDCPEQQAKTAINCVQQKGYGTQTDRDGTIHLEYPPGCDRPLPHLGT
jgi:hypothetical protein